MFNLVSTFTLSAFLLVFSLPAQANPNPFFIGQTVLNTRVLPDHDTLNLGACPNFTTGINRIQIMVQNRAADIDSLSVVYGNGVRDLLPIRERFARGSKSRWIDLRGVDRCIEKISISGDSEGRRGQRSRILFYGLK